MTADQQPNTPTDFPFAVEIEGIAAGWFTECSGLSIERDVTPHPEGGVNDFVHQLPEPVTRTSITLKRGLADNTLWDWFQQGVYDGQVAPRSISVVYYHPDGSEAGRWNLTNAWPTKWSADSLQTASNQTLIETLELTQNGSTSTGTVVSRKTADAVVQRTIDDTDDSHISAADEIDLPALAQRIYSLLKREMRLERDRLGRHR